MASLCGILNRLVSKYSAPSMKPPKRMGGVELLDSPVHLSNVQRVMGTTLIASAEIRLEECIGSLCDQETSVLVRSDDMVSLLSNTFISLRTMVSDATHSWEPM